MNISEIVFVGTGRSIVAFRKSDGHQLWQKSLSVGLLSVSGGFVTLLVDGDLLFAHAMGEIHCLNALTGELIWRDELKGLGYQVASIAMAGKSAPGEVGAAVIQAQKRQQQAAL
ncbi:MAG: PQQ-binding-like beta-propeller repeat protein [Candidatus Sumerlaeota bacterium]